MAQLNVYIGEDAWGKFKELRFLLKCKTNKEVIEKIILNVYKQLNDKAVTTPLP